MSSTENKDSGSTQSQPSCPVDSTARSRWASLFSFGGGSSAAAAPHPVPANPTTAESCPVDHAARAKWASLAQTPAAESAAKGCDSSTLSSNYSAPKLPAHHPSLGKDREISSIPRASLEGSNSEHEGAEAVYGAKGGNWIYPSEEMFFAAMRRKAHDPQAADMRTIVPIHNAVNERAWAEIKAWEKGWGSESCGGPKLASFAGDSQKLTPRARFKTWLGYAPPFDRHDWTVDRCGKKVEYVIDFYAGKKDPRHPEKVSFYLDVRPKLSVEGVKMRTAKWLGQWF
ncbi:cytochrome c1 heme lyase [Sphaerosporella brunnea]|uniref:Holocytochrome c-type synthase n=1 Tax=Sphaerosporella brunnea TaxID=1250544 RepID=A0A5J5EF39_9PEZI|nr:cytochrome c1 heme lyase [Sphaerosporella brunnea]